MHFSKFDEDIIDSEIQKLLDMNVLEKVSYDKNLQFLPDRKTRASEQGLTYTPGQCHRLIPKMVFKI